MKSKFTMPGLTWADLLWGPFARPRYLFVAAAFLLFMMLGGRELWTQEHRWADIVSGMFFRHDFFHPYLGLNSYYDKPLLSYWLIAFVAMITHHLNTWALRLPSAFAGVLAVWSIYKLGWRLRDKHFGLLCGWLLLTTFFFVFWARVSSADMLNLAGSLLAVAWYFEKRDDAKWSHYAIFYLILALTSLCKGLVGAVVPVLAILPDLLYQQRWKKHFHAHVFLAAVPALIVYMLPFAASSYWDVAGQDSQNGLYLVYRENFLRYFQPFDHKDPIYTYFLFLPIYLLPWTLLFIPALVSIKTRWQGLHWNSRWVIAAFLLLFVFFTLSGSRRSYYVLPMLPFAILVTADWLYAGWQRDNQQRFWLGRLIAGSFLSYLVFFGALQPLFYAQGGHRYFAAHLQQELQSIPAASGWQFVLLDPESKVSFYLQLPPQVKYFGIVGDRHHQTLLSLIQSWPLLTEKPKNVIFISRQRYENLLRQLLPQYRVVQSRKTLGERLFHLDNSDAAIAFIPMQL